MSYGDMGKVSHAWMQLTHTVMPSIEAIDQPKMWVRVMDKSDYPRLARILHLSDCGLA